jgi:hypothetical protein
MADLWFSPSVAGASHIWFFVSQGSNYVGFGNSLCTTATQCDLTNESFAQYAGALGQASYGPGPYFPAGFTTVPVAAVPEPSAYILMLADLGVVGFAVRRRQRSATRA